MWSIRTWHTYLGILIAPSVMFFALTGALQLFSLHEAHGSYKPPPLIEELSKVHKDQVFALEEHHQHGPAPSEEAQGHSPPDGDHDEEPRLGVVLLKWFFLVVALSLCTSTLLGLWMGLTHIRHKRAGWWLLGIGIIVPAVLVIIGS